MGEPQSADELYDQLGFGAGEGPFHVKGMAYLFHDRWVVENLPGGREAQFAALGRSAEHEFYRQIFIGGTRYDVFPLVALGYACASLRNESLESFVVMRARYHAVQDLRYIRKFLVKIASPSAVAKRFPSILSSYFDFGTPHTDQIDGSGARGGVAGVPAILARWMIATCEGFATYTLEVNGAKNIRIGAEVTERDEPERGLQMVDLHFTFRWD